MKNILVPTDYSPTSKQAFFYALEMAKIFGTKKVTLIHAFMPETASEFNIIPPIEEYIKIRKNLLDDILVEGKSYLNTLGATDIAIETDVLIGFAVDEICKASEEADLIIMGTTGSGTILEKLFGSVSTGVVQKANCPVLLIPKKATFQGFEHLLYACNYESASEDTIEKLKTFNKSFNANIHFIHVHNDKKEDFNKTKAEIFTELFEKAAPDFAFEFGEIDGNSITDGLNEYAKKHEVDLVVMVTRNRNLWEQIFHKSQTRKMVLGAELPILVLHAED